MSQKYDAEKFISCYKSPDAYTSLRQIADACGLTYDVARKRASLLQRRGVIAPWADRDIYRSEQDRASGVAEKQQILRASNESLIRELKRERAKTEVIAEAVDKAVSKLSIPVVAPPQPPNPLMRERETEGMHVMIGDSQIGQCFQFGDTGGLSAYSFDDFCKRLKKLQEKIELFHARHSDAVVIDRLVINWLGDIVEGEGIFPSQQWYVDKIVVDQIFEGAAKFAEFQLAMAQLFPLVENFCVWGNHGRVNQQSHKRVNWDYIFYRFLRQALVGQSNIQTYVSTGPFMVVRHGEKLFFLMHGDQVTRWMGIPYYGLERMASKLAGLTGLIVDYVQIGHHHRAADISFSFGDLMVNGCWAGGSELSINRMQESSVPSQTMYMLHPRRGIHSVSKLMLAEPVVLVETEKRTITPVVE